MLVCSVVRKKLQFLNPADIREKEDYTYLISVDGGVNLSTVQDVATAGADLAVTGSAFFLSEDKAEFVNKMNDLIRKCQ